MKQSTFMTTTMSNLTKMPVAALSGLLLVISLSVSGTGASAQCFTSQPIAGSTDKCKECYQTLRTYPDNGVDQHCDFENGRGYNIESGSKCVGVETGYLVCKDRPEEGGKYFKCDPVTDWGNVGTCLMYAGVDIGLCVIECATFVGCAICVGQSIYTILGPCGPCALTPCTQIETAPAYVPRVWDLAGECPPPA